MIDFDALEAANAPLNAFTDFDRAAKGGAGLLSGVTVGVKANIMVKGLSWSSGCEAFRDRMAQRDAEVVSRLRGAGAIILGTMNMEEAALGAVTNNPWFGATQNPHRLGHTAGGSSGGSAAGVAAGLCDVALGSDTMGSVRIPAAYCGVYGFKPAHAAISQDGLELTEPSLDTIGPLARDLDMLERVARVISAFGDHAHYDVLTLRDLGGVECSADVLRCYNWVRQRAHVDGEIAVPHPLSRIRFAGFIAASKWLAAHLADMDQALLSPLLKKLLTYGPDRADSDWMEDQRILKSNAAALKAALGPSGILLLPTAPQAAFPHSEAAPANQADFTCLANIAGLPAITIPAGWSSDGLPVGVQLIGNHGFEPALFALANSLDGAINAYRPPAIFGL
jgi:aspartyl-tRNA(Asn)/glutamyl-tRNA(Gln) amidotransferase subunit A